MHVGDVWEVRVKREERIAVHIRRRDRREKPRHVAVVIEERLRLLHGFGDPIIEVGRKAHWVNGPGRVHVRQAIVDVPGRVEHLLALALLGQRVLRRHRDVAADEFLDHAVSREALIEHRGEELTRLTETLERLGVKAPLPIEFLLHHLGVARVLGDKAVACRGVCGCGHRVEVLLRAIHALQIPTAHRLDEVVIHGRRTVEPINGLLVEHDVEEIQGHCARLGQHPSVDGHVGLGRNRCQLQGDARQHLRLIGQDNGLNITGIGVFNQLER